MAPWEGRVAAATLILRAHAAQHKDMTPPDIAAFLWYQLLGEWDAPATATAREANMMSNRLNRILSASPPELPSVQAGLEKFVNKVNEALRAGPVNRAEITEHFEDFPNRFEEPSNQYLVFTEARAQALSWWQILALTEDQAQAFTSLLDVTEEVGVHIPTPVSLHPEFTKSWVNMTLQEKLILLALVAMDDPNFHQTPLVASIAGVIIAFTKGEEITDRWLQKRFELISRAVPHLDLSVLLTRDAVVTFTRKYMQNATRHLFAYKFLSFCYGALEGSPLQSFQWVVEQATVSHCSHALFVCSAIYITESRMTLHLSDPALLDQVREWAKVVILMHNNPWLGLESIPIAASKYPDLANIGYAVMVLLEPQKVAQYASGPGVLEIGYRS
ncbi:Hypothetical protein NTJ_03904 [Nesidiocoris tenuis]|uniref:Uncharacterized protein n=1 Tax=Nesidiocoris tenuis TaxID=355587 RepID=A0ABN7AJP2_9HEMI|nr:Hypothetical protein NTJ_03904 [Nesidiocoris tenuis]